MPGIVGYCSSELDPASPDPTLGTMITSIFHQPWYQVVQASGATVRCACIHLGHFDHAVLATTSDRQIGVMLNGWLFGWQSDVGPQQEPPTDVAQYCLWKYLEQGTDFVHHLNGQFNMLIWDDRRRLVSLVNDRYGMRPWQYACFDANLYFAPEAKAILAASSRSGELNLRMVVNQLSWGRVWIGQETFFEDIMMLPPASILSWRDGRITVEQYWDYVYQPESNIDDTFIEHAVAIFQQAVARQTQMPLRYGVSLSGGLDSRSVLAALSQQSNTTLQAYTWGVSDTHDEVTIAQHIARQLRVPWKLHVLAPVDFISEASRGIFLTEGLDLLVQSYGLKVYPFIQKQTDALLTGLALDLTLGGSYLSSALTSRAVTSDSALSYVLEKAALFSPDECLQLMRHEDAVAILERLRRQALHELQTGQNEHLADQCDRFFLRSRVWRYTFMRQAWQRLFVEDIAPTFDNEFIDCLLRIPPAWRVGHRFYQRFLQRLDPHMMKIAYQRTMLPPEAPLEFWQVGAQLEHQKEQLCRDIWHATAGQIFLPYRRFFTNYDEWLRCDQGWISMADDLLLSPKSLSCDRFLNQQYVASLLAEHRSGKYPHHQKIIQLMTLELFLRQFFN